VLATAYFIYSSFKNSKKDSDNEQAFNDLYTDSLAKELEAQKKFEAEYYSNINDVVEFEAVEIPEPIVTEKKVAKKKAVKKKSTKKTSKKRTANKVVKDEEV
jgi:hypothetical protein